MNVDILLNITFKVNDDIGWASPMQKSKRWQDIKSDMFWALLWYKLKILLLNSYVGVLSKWRFTKLSSDYACKVFTIHKQILVYTWVPSPNYVSSNKIIKINISLFQWKVHLHSQFWRKGQFFKLQNLKKIKIQNTPGPKYFRIKNTWSVLMFIRNIILHSTLISKH